MKTAFVVGAGDFCELGLQKRRGDILVAADGGADALKACRLSPDMVIGDADSQTSYFKGVRRLRFPKHKDDTDMALALRLLKAKGFRRFRLYGATGDPDHTLGNYQLLCSLAREGMDAAIIAPNYEAYAVSKGVLSFQDLPKGLRVSVFCWGERAEGVLIRGLEYSLENAVFDAFTPLGVSNSSLGKNFQIGVREGCLLILIDRLSPEPR